MSFIDLQYTGISLRKIKKTCMMEGRGGRLAKSCLSEA